MLPSLPSQRVTRSTPFPNHLLDEVMPMLKDTEWRILCVIVRQTLGWSDKDSGRRKTVDWLTQSQLQARTGRATEALSRAVDTLVRRGLIEVWNDQGELLLTPQARRRCSGRLFYSLRMALLSAWLESEYPPSTNSQSINSQSEQPGSESEVRKANTTKETQTKYLPYGREQNDREPRVPGSPTGNRKFPVKKYPLEPPVEPPNPDVKRFLYAYRDAFRQHTVRGDPPVMNWGKDGKLVKDLLKLYSYERLVDLLDKFFSSSDGWVHDSGYSLAAFKATIGQLLVKEYRRGFSRSFSRTEPVTLRGSRWSRAGANLLQANLPQRYHHEEDP